MPRGPMFWLGGALLGAGALVAASALGPPARDEPPSTPDTTAPAEPRTVDDPLAPPLGLPDEWAGLLAPWPVLVLPPGGTAEERVQAVLRDAEAIDYYDGLYAVLRPLGDEAMRTLARIAASERRGDGGEGPRFVTAIHAMVDVDPAAAPSHLRDLASAEQRDQGPDSAQLDEIARALARCGDPGARNALIAALEARVAVATPASVPNPGSSWGLATRVFDSATQQAIERLAVAYAEAGRPQAVGTALSMLTTDLGRHPRYEVARVWARAGRRAEAFDALRATSVDVRRLRRDGAFRAFRDTPEFEYLLAYVLARDRIRVGDNRTWHWPVRLVLHWLRRCAAAGYRVPDQGDRLKGFAHLRGEPEFERLWRAMGGVPW